MADGDKELTMLYIGLAGQHHSSYRAECLGALIAIAGPGACNIGIDNASCAKTCKQLHTLAMELNIDDDLNSKRVLQMQRDPCKGSLRRPWSLQANGDMHITLLRFIIHKTYGSIISTKVKGHATALAHCQRTCHRSTSARQTAG